MIFDFIQSGNICFKSNNSAKYLVYSVFYSGFDLPPLSFLDFFVFILME